MALCRDPCKYAPLDYGLASSPPTDNLMFEMSTSRLYKKMSDTATQYRKDPTLLESALSLVDAAGAKAISILRDSTDLLSSIYSTIKAAGLEREKGGRIIGPTIFKQIYFGGVQRLPVILFYALLLGAVVQAQLLTLLGQFALTDEVYSVTVLVLLHELAPLLVALIMAASSGTAITTELALLKLGGEMELWESFGANLEYIFILPRWIGLVISGLMLSLIFALCSFLGGFVILLLLNLAPEWFTARALFSAASAKDILLLIIKTLCFTSFISFIHCINGFAVKRSITEVPQVANRAVLQSVTTIFILNVLVDFIAGIFT